MSPDLIQMRLMTDHLTGLCSGATGWLVLALGVGLAQLQAGAVVC